MAVDYGRTKALVSEVVGSSPALNTCSIHMGTYRENFPVLTLQAIGAGELNLWL